MARSFNGTSDVILIPFAICNTLNGGSAFSMACWFNGSAGQSCIRLQPNGSQYAILYWSNNSPTGTTQDCILAFDGGTSTPLSWTGSGSPASPQDSKWHHLATSWAQNGTWAIYTDGSLTASRAAGSTAITFTVNSFNPSIGDYNGGPQEFTSGSVADVGIWTTNLTAGEIAALAKGARPRDIRPGNLLSWFPLDGLSSPEPDFSGNKNNGTLTGTALASGPPVMQFTPRIPIIQPAIVAAVGPSFKPAWAMRKNIIVEGFAT